MGLICLEYLIKVRHHKNVLSHDIGKFTSASFRIRRSSCVYLKIIKFKLFEKKINYLYLALRSPTYRTDNALAGCSRWRYLVFVLDH